MVRLICSSSESRVGVGNLLFLTVKDDDNWLSEDEHGKCITDHNGDKYYVYDYVREDDIKNMM